MNKIGHLDYLQKYPAYFLLVYGLSYASQAVSANFLPVYLTNIGCNKTSVGFLMALGPVAAIIGQPIWGIATDRARVKNSIVRLLFMGSIFAMLIYPLSTNYSYLIFITFAFMFFQASIHPMTDAITLEQLDNTEWKFAPIRMAGTIGYAVMAVAAGIIANRNIKYIFAVYILLALSAYGAVFLIPDVKGHRMSRNKPVNWGVFKNRELLMFLSINLIIQVTFGFNSSFFPVYYRQLGADNILLGWATFISAASEVPFLMFAHRIINKLGIRYTIIGACIVTSARWVLMYFNTNVYTVLVLQALHGLMFIVISYCTAIFINSKMPPEMKATGQAVNAVISTGVARITGNLLGGYLSDLQGVDTVYFYCFMLSVSVCIIFGTIFINERKNNMQ